MERSDTSEGRSAPAAAAGSSAIAPSSSRRTRTTPACSAPISSVSIRSCGSPSPAAAGVDTTRRVARGGSRPSAFGSLAAGRRRAARTSRIACTRARPVSVGTGRSSGARRCHSLPARASSSERAPGSPAESFTSATSSSGAATRARSTKRDASSVSGSSTLAGTQAAARVGSRRTATTWSGLSGQAPPTSITPSFAEGSLGRSVTVTRGPPEAAARSASSSERNASACMRPSAESTRSSAGALTRTPLPSGEPSAKWKPAPRPPPHGARENRRAPPAPSSVSPESSDGG
ncbi:hypothetical protein SCE1572_14635 [Sorangium cellulosum So0157-2]|uniref:Uncharacterized protein n=1 Tax=Sorangium cellulosum So0157-2 TaxID=1254432 RepID=S4XSX7_SORCE|nr:hypothetical protein [Sorangium cellulosum]AGP35654.1 hypothetical protein SCE1572_14635 [Sorangium cellulosum So0157-2]